MPSSILSLPTDLTSSRRALVLATAGASVALTASSIFTFQYLRRATLREKLRKSVKKTVGLDGGWPDEMDGGVEEVGVQAKLEKEALEGARTIGRHGAGDKKKFSEELIREQLSRNYTFLGEEGMQKVRDSYVVVVGCGGVGSWAALMLLRSGVSRLLLIDFDMATLSSLNRHASATLADVGTPKVLATKKFLEKIAPWATIETSVSLWRDSPEGYALLEGADWVVDAIDNITTKAQLLAHCHKSKIKVFSSMGAGAKMDPTRVQISDISTTSEDPLARVVRQNLRSHGIHSGIPCVYSTEVPASVKLLPLPEAEFAKGNVKELGAFDDFRVRILPVLGPLPAIFGLNIATYILQDLAGKPILQPMEGKNRKKVYQKLNADYVIREGKIAGSTDKFRVPIDNADIGLLYEETHFAGRSCLPPPLANSTSTSSRQPFHPFMSHALLLRPTLTRWDFSEPISLFNVVIMDSTDVETHERECLKGGRTPGEVWGEEVVEGVKGMQEEVRRIVSWREREGRA